MHELEQYCKDVQSNKVKYDSQELVRKVENFGDNLWKHLNDVSCC
jgi:hypothetical protein